MKANARRLLGSTALTKLGSFTAGMALLGSNPAHALPQNGQVVGGSASIAQTSATQLDITQNSDRAVINWQSFSIGANEATNFHQPSTSSVAVNRVVGVDPSQIMGRLTANGQVVLVNPNGILFSKTAQVNVGGLVASTSGITTQNAMNGAMIFDQPGAANATIVNQGTITAAQGGLVALVAPGIVNNGTITANLGKVSLASGKSWTLDMYGDHLVNFAVSDKVMSDVAGVTHTGVINAAGGTVELSANVAKGIVSNAINMDGIIEADSVSSQGGKIILSAGTSGVSITGTATASGTSGGTIDVSGDSITHQGVLNADGTSGAGGQIDFAAGSTYIDTANATTSANSTTQGGSIALSAGSSLFTSGTHTATSSGGVGGTVTMTAPTTDLVGTTVDVSGAEGGGTISVGGAAQGGGTLAHATTTNVTGSTTLTANAGNTGNGGSITIWSDEETNFAGATYAKGGTNFGNGGTIEVSSASSDHYAGTSDASAANGIAGQLLLDPKTIIVDSAAALFPQFQFINPDVSLTGTFGSVTLSLSSGNVVITDPTATVGLGPTATGAAYLFSGITGQLISTISGTYAGDEVGANVTALTNGNYVVSESTWHGGIGAATFASGSLGVSGAVSSANSLTGSNAGDNVGLQVTALTNGNYIVDSSNWNGGRGAASWGNGTSGLTGTVSASNSLIGSSAGDKVGLGVTVLANGDYVVESPNWNGNKGAASWGDGSVGLTGTVTSSNSLIGSTAGDEVGLSVTALVGGNYVVGSPDWTSSKGAATWANGGAGITGTVTSSNSLIGSLAGDEVGLNVTALSNGNYVVGSPDWTLNKGAATWANGSTGLTGTVSSSNSLIGSLAGDKVGLSVTALVNNGNYVVESPNWGLNKGAASWGSGSAGVTGTISTGNSLIGSTAGDEVGLSVTALTNGNYVVGSPDWTLGKGAATWGSGSIGVKGTITSSNSLIGSLAGDQVGTGITALTNGNYVVQSPLWNGTLGAASWGSGTLGLTGTVSSSNSLIGSLVADEVGLHVTALTDGNYVVGSPLWDLTLGAATYASGTLGLTGTVSSSNSLVGSLVGDLVGSNIVALGGGAYVVGSFGWDGGLGAATLGLAGSVLNGTINSTNSIIGNSILSTPLVTITALGTDKFTVSFGNIGTGSVYEGYTNPNQLTYSADANGTVTIAPSFITQTLDTGTSVTLQANDDIQVNSAIVTVAGGNGGALTLQSGRSLILNNSITTDNGNLTLIANDTAADGVVNADRDAGNASITMAAGTTLNAGTGAVSITTKTGAGVTNAASGTITLNTVIGGSISVVDQTQKTLTLNGDLIASNSGDSIVLSSGVLVNNVGSTVLNPGAGRYVLYSIDPTLDTLDGLSGYTKHYGISYAMDGPSNYTTGGNYSLYSVVPTVTITAANASRAYGSVNPTLSYSASGLIDGDTIGTALTAAPSLTTSATTASNVGSYGITVGGGLTSSLGYTIVTTNGTLSVTPASLTIIAGSTSRTYGAANPVLSASYNGLVNGDGSAVVTGLTLATTATSLSNVGSYAISASGALAANYTISYGPSGTLSVTPASLTITANNASRTYGASNPGFSASYSGFVNGDTSSAVSGLTLSTAATTLSSVGSYAINASGATSANYSVTYGAGGLLSITPAALTITANNASRTYGAANPTFTATYSGLVNGESSGVVTNLMVSTSATTSSNVGSYVITAGGAIATNYAIAYVNGTLSVTPAALTITAGSASRRYGAANPALSASYSGFVNSDTSSVVSGLTLATSATTASNIGSYAITASGALAGNYTIGYVNGALSITPAALTITANNATRTYGAANPAFSASYTGLVNGDTSSVVSSLTLATPATTASSVGSYAIAASGASAGNYTISYGANGALSITPAALTITAHDASRTYGASNPTFSATYTGLVSGDGSGVVTNLLLGTSATTASNVGTYTISASNAAATNYAIAYVNGTLSVTPAALTITANNSTRTYGAANPTLSASYSGFVNSDMSGVVSGLTLSTAATTASNVGSYAITGSGATAQNYTIAYGPSGMLSVTPASLTITADNATRSYGAGNPALSATYTGLVNGDSSTVVSGLSLTTSATSASNVGSYAIVAGGGTAGNYTVSYGANGMLSITPVALTITPDNSTRLYGAANPTFSATYNGLVNGDTSSAIVGYSLTTSATTASNVGAYAITGSGGSDANYTIGYGPAATLLVTPAPLTITTSSSTRSYGQANPTLSASYTGLVNGDTSAVVTGLSLATDATTASNVGAYAITASGGASTNYAITYGPSGMLVVTPASLTITPNGATRLYGGQNVFSASFSGLTAGDTSTAITGLTLASAATPSSNVGTYAVTASGGMDANYNITYGPSATLTVTPAPLTIAPNDSIRLAGDNNSLTANIYGLTGNDTAASLVGLQLSTTATTASPIGSYPIVASGAVDGNYMISYGPNATLSIVTTLPAPPVTHTPTVVSSTDSDPSTPVMTQDQLTILTNGPVMNARYVNNDTPSSTPVLFQQAVLNQIDTQVVTSATVAASAYNAPYIDYTNTQANESNQTLCLKVSLDSVGAPAGKDPEDSCSAPLALKGY